MPQRVRIRDCSKDEVKMLLSHLPWWKKMLGRIWPNIVGEYRLKYYVEEIVTERASANVRKKRKEQRKARRQMRARS